MLIENFPVRKSDMRFERLNQKLLDVSDDDSSGVILSYSVDDLVFIFKLHELLEFQDLKKIISHNDSLTIQSTLNFDVVDFDGEKIYHGRKKGLRLYGTFSETEMHRYVFIFSGGEFQPSRFQFFLEGYLTD